MAFLAAAGPLLSAVGTVVSIGTGLAAASYQSKVAEMNAKIAQDNARKAAERGRIAAEEQDRQTRAALGEQLAVQAASGVNINSKSSMLTRKAARTLGRQDALRARIAGESEAYNYRTDAANYVAQGRMAKMQGFANALGAGIDGLSTLVGSARPTARTFNPYVPNPVPRPRSLLS